MVACSETIPVITRRQFLYGLSGSAAFLFPEFSWAQERSDTAHRIDLDLPILASDPASVPLTVSLDHPMELGHSIRSFQITLDTDPVPYKGKFTFTPANGRPWVSFPMRSGIGGLVKVVAECSRHGRFVGTREVQVVEGGCATLPDRVERERLGNPMIRLPRSYRVGEVVEVRTKVDHSSHTGLVLRGGKYVRELPEFYLSQMLVYVDAQKVSEFEMTSAVSPNPVIRFPLRISGPGTLKIVFVNNEGQRWEALQAVRPTA